MLLTNEDTFLQKTHILVNSIYSVIVRQVLGIKQSHVVICGFPRSGTSLLYNMVSSTISHYTATEFEKYFIHHIHKIGNFITKAPMDVLHLKHLDKMNKNRKKMVVLIVVRDIRDVITSRHPILPDEFFIGYDHSWWPQDSAFKSWGYDAPGVIELHQAIQDSIQRSDTLLVHYEDLVATPDGVKREIEERFALQFKGNFLEYHKDKSKHAYRYEGGFSPKDPNLVQEGKQVTVDRVARWKKDQRQVTRVIQQFEECPQLFDVLEAYGYEKNRDWFTEISS